MTDTPTPAMTPEQRAELVKSTKVKAAMINLGEAIQWGSETILMEQCANQLEADGVTIATLTAERDAAQAEIARLTAALATAREDGMREAAEALRKTWWRGELTSEDFDAVEKGAAT